MAQAIFESIFDIWYLVSVVTMGIIMVKKNGGNSLVKKFGIMAIILGGGDSFHLVPRMYALWTTGLEANATALGFGKFVTSITMTVFYLILYYIWRQRYGIKENKGLTATIWTLAIIRVVLCLFPQNDWLNYQQPLKWGILRNIPFAIMGLIIILIFAQQVKKTNDKVFKYMPLAISLSFLFYIPVVLFSSTFPLIGMLMIPKTVAYAWIVKMGWNLSKESKLN